MPQNNFQIFNENNNPYTTMSDEEYASLDYRTNGLIPMIADPIAHNKMYRQWSIMAKAVANMICDKGYNALDTDVTDLKNNLKTSVKGLARDELQSDINSKADIDHTHTLADITDVETTANELNVLHGLTATAEELNTLDGITSTTEELNILDGVTASTAELNILDGAEISTTELNYLSGAKSNIQTQINNLSISAFIPLRQDSTAYAIGDVVKIAGLSTFQYLECIASGTSGATMPAYADVGQMVTDNEVKWLVCDFRDSAPVGTIKQDLVKRDGWLKLNGATVNVADYPRLVSFLTENSLIQPYATYTTTKFKYGDINNETLRLPNFGSLFIENSNSSSDTLNEVSAGLPNITGGFSVDSQGSVNLNIKNVSGAFKRANQISMNQAANLSSTYNGYLDATFKASDSNSIYGNSTTVQPPAVKLIPVIKY